MSTLYKPLGPRKTFAIVMLIVTIALGVGSAMLSTWEHSLAAEIAAFNHDPDAPISGPVLALALSEMAAALATLVVLVVTAVAFLMWQYRAAANARALGTALRISPGWAVGWWYPVGNIYMPVRSILEISKASEPFDDLVGLGPSPASSAPLLIGVWWVSWLGSNVLGCIAGESGWNAQAARAVRDAAAMSIGAEVLSVLAGALAIAVVLSISTRQAMRARSPHDTPWPTPDDRRPDQ
jgi:hypothetical protein